MEWLNYHHLLYFWMVAREGTVARAAQLLRLAQPTISAQIRTLEGNLGVKLFKKSGRNLVLTPDGEEVFRYAQEIFALGQELQHRVRHGTPRGPRALVVGVDNAMPKLVANALLEPALEVPGTTLECREDSPQNLMARLAVQQLDIVLTDAPLAQNLHVHAFNHLLGSSPVGLFAPAEMAAKLRAGFPHSLSKVKMLLPSRGLALRSAVDAWLNQEGLSVDLLAEFDDSALMKAFAHHRARVFPACTAVAAQIKEHHGYELIHVIPKAKQDFYAITVERRLRHPALVSITRSARQELFAR